MFEEKEKRYRLACLKQDEERVINNINKYDNLTIIGKYEKVSDGWNVMILVNIIVDSIDELDYNFVQKFNKEVNEALGTFENYDRYFD
jgi:hypothetical protein